MGKSTATSLRHYKNKLQKVPRKTNLHKLLVMCWSVSAVMRGEDSHAKRYLNIPDGACGAQPGSQLYASPWTIETLINEALCTPFKHKRSGRTLNTGSWLAFTTLYNLVNEIKNSESLSDVPEGKLLDALPRVTWRQFGWQRGYETQERMFRAHWLYNFPEANQLFEARHGISIERFTYVGFVISSLLREHPAILQGESFEDVGISDAEKQAFLQVVAVRELTARNVARNIRQGKGQIAYKPSALRKYPLIKVRKGDQVEVFCPLVPLLALRCADGLFYDLIDDDNLRRQIAVRFEQYVAKISGHYFKGFADVLMDQEYGPKSSLRATPDIRLVTSENALRVVVECKSRRLPFRVLSSANPLRENQNDYADVTKGVVQIWRYFSDVRRGRADRKWDISQNPVGVVLTLEPWLQSSTSVIESVLGAAEETLSNNPDIAESDKVPVCFVCMADWEYSLRKSVSEGFLDALKVHTSPEKYGYDLSSTIKEVDRFGPIGKAFDYQGKLSEIVDWNNDLMEGRMPIAR